MPETWKKISFAPRYSVSSLGKVKNTKTGRILKFALSRGYPMVTVIKDKKRRQCPIHRLVALHFLPNPEQKPQVDHINGDRKDNTLKNLRWVTHAEQMLNRKGFCATSSYKGVSWHVPSKKWVVHIARDGKAYHCGLYKCEEDACTVYNEIAKLLHGEYARLNEEKRTSNKRYYQKNKAKLKAKAQKYYKEKCLKK